MLTSELNLDQLEVGERVDLSDAEEKVIDELANSDRRAAKRLLTSNEKVALFTHKGKARIFGLEGKINSMLRIAKKKSSRTQKQEGRVAKLNEVTANEIESSEDIAHTRLLAMKDKVKRLPRTGAHSYAKSSELT